MLELIPTGKENAISRRELVSLTSLKDRVVRLRIEQYRNEGICICSNWSEGAKGYYLPGNEAEQKEFLKNYSAYIKKMAKTYSKMANFSCKADQIRV